MRRQECLLPQDDKRPLGQRRSGEKRSPSSNEDMLLHDTCELHHIIKFSYVGGFKLQVSWVASSPSARMLDSPRILDLFIITELVQCLDGCTETGETVQVVTCMKKSCGVQVTGNIDQKG